MLAIPKLAKLRVAGSAEATASTNLTDQIGANGPGCPKSDYNSVFQNVEEYCHWTYLPK